MSIKTIALLAVKLVALTLLLFAYFMVGSLITSIGQPPASTSTTTTLLALLMVCLLDTIVLAYPILRSRWTGWRLVATMFLAFFGISTLFTPIERRAADLTTKGLDPLNMTMHAIANQGMDVRIADPIILAGSVRAGKPLGLHTFGRSPPALDLAPRSYSSRCWLQHR